MSAIQGRQAPSNQAPVGGVGQARLGGAPVQHNASGGIRRALTDFAHKVQSFVSGLGTRFENWKQGRALEAATRQANAAADTLVDAMKAGTLGPSSSAAFEALQQASTRADAGYPTALAGQVLSAKLAALPQAERTKACFADFGALGAAMKSVGGQRIDAAHTMMRKLADAGLSEPPTGNPQAQKAKLESGIDSFVAAAKDAVRGQRLSDLQAFAKAAFAIAPDGQVTGTVTNGRLPDELIRGSPPPRAAHGSVHTAASLIEARCQGRIDLNTAALTKPQAERTKDESSKIFPTHGGIQVSSQAVGDFHRMNFNIENNGQVFNTRLPPGSNDRIQSNVVDSVNALRAFAGSDAATTVLSAVTHQYDLRDIVRMFAGPAGETVALKPLPNGFDHAQAKLPGGGVETIDNPGQIGDAEITLTHTPAGDFKVIVTWDFVGASLSDGGEDLPVDPSNPRYAPNSAAEKAVVPNVLKIALSGSFVISAADAAAGRLRIDPTSAQFQQTVSGRLAVPS